MSTVMLAEIASLLGDPSRAHILTALLDGRSLTSKELASVACIAPQTASGHLTKLVSSNLLKQDKQGRHRYFRLASADVARMLEEMLNVASTTMPSRYRPVSKVDEKIRLARTCYDHLAGKLGVAITDALVAKKLITLNDDAGEVTKSGLKFFSGFGIETKASGSAKRCFCRPCLDWTERRHHLAGFIGAALAERLFRLDWIGRIPGSRAVCVTTTGKAGIRMTFGVEL